jgi:lipopolysaccharide biosynthesis regulator YciM
MLLGLIMLFIWIATVVGWIIYNLYNKNRKLEATVLAQANFIAGLQQLIGESDKALKNLDDKIWMESDKELQTVFQNLKAVQEGLNQFNRR